MSVRFVAIMLQVQIQDHPFTSSGVHAFIAGIISTVIAIWSISYFLC